MLNKAVNEDSPNEGAVPSGPGAPCWSSIHQNYGANSGVGVSGLNAFSALHLLRNYNQLLMPPG